MYGIKGWFWTISLFWGFQIQGQYTIAELGVLDHALHETSGLIYFDGHLITHNDSGNTAELFELNPETGQVIRTVRVENTQNVDWEDIDQDENYIYIGDFGNNAGNRTDLVIYRVDKIDFQNSTSVLAEHITFSFEDQTDFDTVGNSDWDAEAFFVFGDNFVLLTKQWQEMGTVAYKIPNLIGNHVAQRMDSYPMDGLITGATYDENTGKLMLVGYSQFLFPFLVEINQISESSIFAGMITKSPLDIGIAQVEAITGNGDVYYMSSEQFTSNAPQITSASRLFSFTIDMETPKDKLVLYQPNGQLVLGYELETEDAIFEQAIFDTSGKVIMYNPIAILRNGAIDISTLGPSIYFLAFYLKEGIVSKPFMVK